MPDLAQTLKQEIARIARRETKKMAAGSAKTIGVLKRTVGDLKKQVADLEKAKASAAQAAGPLPADSAPASAADQPEAKRFTGVGVRAMRTRLGLTQVQFAKLVGLSLNGIVKMESKKGKLTPRKKTADALTTVGGMNRQEAETAVAGLKGKPARIKGKKRPAAKK